MNENVESPTCDKWRLSDVGGDGFVRIVSSLENEPPDLPALIEITPDGEAYYWPEGVDDAFYAEFIELPTDARPGMWAARTENVECST